MYESDVSRWRAVQARDQNAASSFVYAVISTKIYCRPSCPARLARRANVCFYDTAGQAVAAGYRSCLRCKPDQESFDSDSQRVQRDAVRRACIYMEEMKGEAKFADVAKQVGLSTRYLYGLFKTVMGTTPAKYAARFKSGTGTQESSKTPSAVSDAVSPLRNEPIEPVFDALTWNAFLDMDYADFATLPKDSDLPLSFSNFNPEHQMATVAPNNHFGANETFNPMLHEQFDMVPSYLSHMDPNADMYR